MPTERIEPPLAELGSLRQPLTEGEWRVLEFLRLNLGSRWEIYVQPHLNGLRPDFVLLNPAVGVAIIEVKDWDLDGLQYFYKNVEHGPPRLFGNDGRKKFSLAKVDPVAKIHLYKQTVMEVFCPRLPPERGFGVITGSIVFPNANTGDVERLLFPARQYYRHLEFPRWNTVCGRDGLDAQNIKQLLPSAFTQRDDRMNEGQAADLRHWLVEPEVSREQRASLLDGMDKKQLELINSRPSARYRRIRGPAGSGKSVILAARAAKLANEGKRVLIVTFNITLINYLLDYAVRWGQSGKLRDRIVAWNFHYWCKMMAAQTGHWAEYDQVWASASAKEILATRLAQEARSWSSELDENDRFDAVFVDEGQDFRLEWWLALRSVLSEGGEMLLCADRAQNVYGIDQSWTGSPALGSGLSSQWVELTESYRMPPTLCTLAANYLERYLADEENILPVAAAKNLDFGFGQSLNWIQVRPGAEVTTGFEELFRILSRTKPTVAMSDLTVIVENEDIGKEFIKRLHEAKGIHCIDTFRPESGEEKVRERESRRKKLAFFKGDARVKVTTLHSFKGWESTALVLLVTRARTQEDLALAYTGITRLKLSERGSFLLVVCSEERLSSFGKDWPQFSDLRGADLACPFY
jgi:hypothetical protein